MWATRDCTPELRQHPGAGWVGQRDGDPVGGHDVARPRDVHTDADGGDVAAGDQVVVAVDVDPDLHVEEGTVLDDGLVG